MAIHVFEFQQIHPIVHCIQLVMRQSYYEYQRLAQVLLYIFSWVPYLFIQPVKRLCLLAKVLSSIFL